MEVSVVNILDLNVGLSSSLGLTFFSFEQETLLDFVLTPHPPEGLSLRFLSLSGKVASLVPQILLYLILFNPFSNSQRPVDVTAAAS